MGDDGAVVDKSLLSEHCMEGHSDRPKAVSHIKLEALIRDRCLKWLVIKEHLKKMSALEQLSCESMNHELRCGYGCDCENRCSMAENFVGPQRLNLYLDCVNLRMLLIVSMWRWGFAERQAELEQA